MSIKTAIVGLGRMGMRHVENVRALQLPLVGVCDVSRENLKASGLPEDLHFDDFEEMLRITRPACLIVATTAQAHCPLTCLAAEAGVQYILCEKPMAVSIDQTRRMIATCLSHNARLAINHPIRYMESYLRPQGLLEAGEFGALSSMSIIAGNFGIAMNGSHALEAFRFLSGHSPTRIQAWFSGAKTPNPRGPQFDDPAGCFRVENAAGQRLYVEASGDQGHGLKTIYGSSCGQIVVDHLSGRLDWTRRQAAHREAPTTRYGSPREEGSESLNPADALIPSRKVLEGLLDQGGYPSGEEGALAIRALVAAYVSHEEGHRVVHLDEALPNDRIFPWA